MAGLLTEPPNLGTVGDRPKRQLYPNTQALAVDKGECLCYHEFYSYADSLEG